jgi:hypothetical protein
MGSGRRRPGVLTGSDEPARSAQSCMLPTLVVLQGGTLSIVRSAGGVQGERANRRHTRLSYSERETGARATTASRRSSRSNADRNARAASSCPGRTLEPGRQPVSRQYSVCASQPPRWVVPTGTSSTLLPSTGAIGPPITSPKRIRSHGK